MRNILYGPVPKPQTSLKTSHILLNDLILNDAIFWRCLKKIQNIVQAMYIAHP